MNLVISTFCLTCGREFWPRPGERRYATRVGQLISYCSAKCRPHRHATKGKKRDPDSLKRRAEKNKAQPKRKRKGQWFECETCGDLFYKQPCLLRQAEKNGYTIRYCSAACYKKLGIANPFFGKHHSDDAKRAAARRVVTNPKIGFKSDEHHPSKKRFHPYVFRGKSLDWWRRFLLTTVGKCERCGFDNKLILQMHHKDRNSKNNVRDNLELLCPNCHELDHALAGDGKSGASKIRWHGRNHGIKSRRLTIPNMTHDISKPPK